MALIDKDKAVNAIATYLFVNDAIKGPEPKRIVDYVTFAESMLKDIPELDLVRCKECKWGLPYHDQFENLKRRCLSTTNIMDLDEFCPYGQRADSTTNCDTDCSWK